MADHPHQRSIPAIKLATHTDRRFISLESPLADKVHPSRLRIKDFSRGPQLPISQTCIRRRLRQPTPHARARKSTLETSGITVPTANEIDSPGCGKSGESTRISIRCTAADSSNTAKADSSSGSPGNDSTCPSPSHTTGPSDWVHSARILLRIQGGFPRNPGSDRRHVGDMTSPPHPTLPSAFHSPPHPAKILSKSIE